MRSPPPLGGAWLAGVAFIACLAGTALSADPASPVPATPPPADLSTPGAAPQPVPGPAPAAPPPLTLADLEQMAVAGNPTLAQAAANVEAARGRALQAGLCPNPLIGYKGDEIGTDGTAGFQGAFINQLIVTGGKLRLNRAKFAEEVSQVEAQALAQQYRVLNGVRMRYWELLARWRLIEVRSGLVKVAEEAVVTTEELLNVGQANRPDLLQARIEARQQAVGLANARVQYAAAWRQLTALLGQPDLPVTPLAGDLEHGCPVPDYEAALANLLAASPELLFAQAEVRMRQVALKRERVEPHPNVQVQAGPQYDYSSSRMAAFAQVGLRVPLFDRNQGNIRTAQAQLARSLEEVRRVELDLGRRLARIDGRYRAALNVVEVYRKANLPEAREAYELYLESFRRRRAAYPQVLIAQRNYFQIAQEYVQALQEARRAEVTILGLLLVDGLDEPPRPPSEGGRDVFSRREQNQGPGDFRRETLGGEGRQLDERLGNPPQ